MTRVAPTVDRRGVPPVDPTFLRPGEDFRDAVIPHDAPRLVTSRTLNLEDYSQTIIQTKPATELLRLWGKLLAEPYHGITTDGKVRAGLFELADEGFDPRPAVVAARALLDGLDERERAAIHYPLDAREWRTWYNPEWLVNRNGLRLDRASPATREAAMNVLRACLSEEGYLKTERCRSANRYLGELYDLRHVMNEWSYHFLLFGEPSDCEPWGWSLYGHHLALNCLVLGAQLVVSPTFMGAEPAVIDRGPDNRFRLFDVEATAGLELTRSLSAPLRARAIIYRQLQDPAMPPGRWQFSDERHLGGAFRDNRVIPYEGVRGDELDGQQRDALLALVEHFITDLPASVRAARLRQVGAHLDETWWSWIGGYGDGDPFYYRIQSPVIMCEFDHHKGVWLTNTAPAKYHVHTIVRTPNGNDYGKDLLRQHGELTYRRHRESPAGHRLHGKER